MKIKEHEVLDMTADKMDEYLDWYKHTWVGKGSQEHKKRGLPTQLLDMFPTGRPDGSKAPIVDLEKSAREDQEALDSKLKAVQSSFKLRDVVSKEKEGKSKVPIPRIGDFHKRYRKEEDLPIHAKAFYEAAADLIGISLSTLIVAVLQTEQKLLNFRKKQAKEGKNTQDANEDEVHEEPVQGVEGLSLE